MKFESQNFPPQPGVYIMKDAKGTILYIGKAVNLRKRVASYFGSESKNRYQIKFLMEKVVSIEATATDTEKEAILLEHKLIKKHKPRYNLDAKDDKTFYRIKLTTGNAYPAIYLTRRVKKDSAEYFGPYVSSNSAREMLDYVVKFFKLRTCSDREFLNRSRPCIQFDIGRCTAPCVGKVSREAYAEQIERSRLFLNGRNRDLIKDIKEKMFDCSAKSEFEEAAYFRDLIKEIKLLLEKQKVAKPVEETFTENPFDELYGLLAKGLSRKLRITGPLNIIECLDISNISGQLASGAIVSFIDGKPAKNNYRLFNIQGGDEPNDIAMIKEVVERRFARSDWQFPDLLLVDGGRGQVSVASAVLKEKGINIPVVGVAKIVGSHRKGSDNAQIFLQGRINPLKFKRGDRGLLFLIRIRDEAHRFVIGHFRRRHGKSQILSLRGAKRRGNPP